MIDEPRPGYGRAYRTGFAAAQGEVIATADGDATYPVEEIPRLVRKLFDERLDFLSGDRLTLLDAKAMTREHRVGNWALNFVLRIAYHGCLRPAGGVAAGQPERDVGVPPLGPRPRPPDAGRDAALGGAEDRGAPERAQVPRGTDPLRRAVGGARSCRAGGTGGGTSIPDPQATRRRWARGRPPKRGRNWEPGDPRPGRYWVLPGALARLGAEPVVAALAALDGLRGVPGRAVHADALVEQSVDRLGERHTERRGTLGSV